MKGLLAIVAGGIVACVAANAVAEEWQTVYQTDFSTDPGWTTNDSTHTHQVKKVVFRKKREVLIQLGVVVKNPNLEEGASRPCCLSELVRRCKRL
jgi:hypothetical protein